MVCRNFYAFETFDAPLTIQSVSFSVSTFSGFLTHSANTWPDAWWPCWDGANIQAGFTPRAPAQPKLRGCRNRNSLFMTYEYPSSYCQATKRRKARLVHAGERQTQAGDFNNEGEPQHEWPTHRCRGCSQAG